VRLRFWLRSSTVSSGSSLEEVATSKAAAVDGAEAVEAEAEEEELEVCLRFLLTSSLVSSWP